MPEMKGGEMRVVALFVGKPRTVKAPGGTLYTGGMKDSVEAARLNWDGFEGDGQGNLKYHGGPDRTVCVYAEERYAWWRAENSCDLRFGSFSENLTVQGAVEDAVCIGDIYRVGEALVQVSLPRDPCRTIDKVSGIDGLWLKARDAGACGFHMRTLEEGLVKADSAFELVQRHPEGITVAMALDLYHGRSRDAELAGRLCRMQEFAEEGKKAVAARVAGA
jgi:MOSC domain-containing protein YiiM